ncbi:endonuclease VIII [Sedimenticola thiotaurini]|uniref:DNA-(apurinic or apyrimidinic site) lyase n=1 Tax=Sedimenticola thiotaurini TaxID=1543721 RepID=A0A0F7K231_9GAMM|nr:endonuclease VIII [Sedimenticola thiotaurini]AKH21614.1 endonuclease VIII [Sedimenticola thiotaurini]
MPEGPEIRRAADQVAEALQGRPLRRVRVGQGYLKPLISALTGQRVIRVDTLGKAMLTRFDNGLTLYTHNQLYGRWKTGPADLPADGRRQLRIALVTDRSAAHLYSATTIELLNDQQVGDHPFLSRLGPDILHPETDKACLLERLSRNTFRNRRLGQLLTDQSFVAGLGNYLRCEILFVSGLHPDLRPTDCHPAQLESLTDALLELPARSYHSGGITNDPARAQRLMADGATFEQARFHLFRREGLPCYHCGEPIRKSRNAGQACYLCSRCQPAKT